MSQFGPLGGAILGEELGGGSGGAGARKQSPLESMVLYGMAHPGASIPVPQSVQQGAPLVDISPQSKTGLMDNPLMMFLMMQALKGQQPQQGGGMQMPGAIMNAFPRGLGPGGAGGSMGPGALPGFSNTSGVPTYNQASDPDFMSMGAMPSAAPDLSGLSQADMSALGSINGAYAGLDVPLSADEMDLLYGVA